jgi:hypothetical protein
MIVDSMSKQEVMDYIRREYNSTVLPYFHTHIKLYRAKIYPICQRGKQKKVILPWEKVLSKNQTVFQFQVFGDKNGIDSVSYVEFDWQGQHCFAYIKHDLMIVFSQHALRRYAERVLNRDISSKDIFNSLLKDISLSYRTVLPSQSHPLNYYFVIINALFLGDFDETSYSPTQDEGAIWLNTCISLKETGVSQKGILNTLSLMPFYIKQIGFNPFDHPDKYFKSVKELISSRDKKWYALLCLSQSVFLIDKLFVMMDLPVSKTVINVFNSEMRYAGVILEMGGIETSKLSPYGANGIAIRGELDYKGTA